MSSHLRALLADWYPQRDTAQWVLGTVYATEGPAYRKAGAMMLFSHDGQQLGMLSGGCLESDIHRHARQVMQRSEPVTLTYDGSDEDDVAFQLGIGCGGTVHILLQPLSVENDYLSLVPVYEALRERRSGLYRQRLPGKDAVVEALFDATVSLGAYSARAQLRQKNGERWLHTPVMPPPHVLIAGGGVDARPLATLAHDLGWDVSVWDPRPANARREYFTMAEQLLRCPVEELGAYVERKKVNAAVLMTHNVPLDAEVLRWLSDAPLDYLALLGPVNRRRRVMSEAGVSDEALRTPLSGPAGLDIGATLPETIALSILAECQAVLQRHAAQSLHAVREA